MLSALAALGLFACQDAVDDLGSEPEPEPEEVEIDDDPVLAAELAAIVDADPLHGRCDTPVADLAVAAEDDATVDTLAAAEPVTIKVAFHVIRARIDGKMRGDISGKRIRRQIRVLNDAFSSTRFRFELASVTRTTNRDWFRMRKGSAAERNAKNALHRGGTRVLNIYSTGTRSALGWATFPWDEEGDQDGIVVQFGTTPSGTSGRFTLGDTAVHEAGHWLGLFHTFGLLSNGCESGDAIADTAEEKTPAFGCPNGRNTCPEPGDDPIHNFMDYTDDSCMFRFSPKQRSRMSGMWNKWRG
jgi:hypothetical protein